MRKVASNKRSSYRQQQQQQALATQKTRTQDESIADMLANAEHERCDAPIENRTYYVAAITRSGRSTNAMHISEIFDFEQDDMG
jgi:hypothetical protein